MKPLTALLSASLAACACPQATPQPPTQPPAVHSPTSDHADFGSPRAHHGHGAHPSHGGPEEGDTRAPLVHRFDETDPETWAKRFESEERDAYQQPDQVVTAMALTQGMHVADIGTGTGYFVPRLSKAVGATGRVHAVDIAPNMVRYVKARVAEDGLDNVSVGLALLDDPLLDADSLDRILIVNTWHHIAEREAYSGKLAAALRPGGAVFIVDFKVSSRRGPSAEHKLGPERVADELRAGGLVATIDADLVADQYVVRATKPTPGG